MGNKYAVFIPNEHGDVRAIYDSALNGPADQRAAAAETLLSTALSLSTVPGLSRYKTTGPMFRAAYNLTKDPEALNLEAREYYEAALEALDSLEALAKGEKLAHGPSYYVAEVRGFAKEAISIANKMMGVSSASAIKAEVESGKFLNISLPGVSETVKVISMPKGSVGKDGTFHTSTGAFYQQAAGELIAKSEQLMATADAIDLTDGGKAQESLAKIAQTKADAALSSVKVSGFAGIDGKVLLAILGLVGVYFLLRD